MSKISTLLFGAAIGAGLVYFYDPEQGNRRKAMIRDRALRLRNDADEAVQAGISDLRNRAKGIFAEGMALVSEEGASDELIAERIRSRLGFLTHHPGAVNIQVQNKTAYVSGDVLQSEVDGLMAGVSKIKGVKGVENQLRVHQNAGNIPQLQGQGWMPGDETGKQWTPGGRLLAGAGAGYLLLYGAARGGLIGFIARVAGLGLGARAITNLDFASMAGMTQSPDAIRVRKTINIDAPVDQVYDLWSNFENFPRFMSNVDQIKDLGNGRSHWVVKGPAGSKVEFDAIVTEEKPNEVVAWKTTEDSTVKHRGQVRFKEGNKQGTQVSVNMAYTPPAGVVGHAVASMFGVDPKSSMDSDLVRMKSLLEEGKTTTKGHTVTEEHVMSSHPKGAQIPRTGGQESSSEPYQSQTQGQADQSHQQESDQDQPGMIPNTGSDNTTMSTSQDVDPRDFTKSSYDEDAMNPPAESESGDEDNSHPLSD